MKYCLLKKTYVGVVLSKILCPLCARRRQNQPFMPYGVVRQLRRFGMDVLLGFINAM
jgi:hypothetical protein